MGIVGGGQFQCGADAVGLYCGNRAVEQTGRFRRVRRDQRRCFARGERDVQIAFTGHQVQRVGVEHEWQSQVENAVQDDAGLVAATHAGAASQCGEIGRQQLARRAHHQLRLQDVERGSVLVEEADIDPAAAQAQRRAPGEQCGADHAASAAKNAGAAEAALVAVRLARAQELREKIGSNSVPRISVAIAGADIHVERRHRDFAAVIRPIRRQQAGLVADESQRMGGTDRFAQRFSGIGVESARAVEREEWARVAHRQGVGCPNQAGVGFLDRTR